jgi:tRNA nucleotidyltransferase (CCA-adding enzyme)
LKAYIVGGAVRDELLGQPVTDRDWVVVGATPEEMAAAGYRPVGKDFPVFLHPRTKEEYALARTERKSGRGYKGFTVYAAPDVTLEDDLRRRDLTINAMAKDDAGRLVDPFGGARDLKARVLRHVSEAFAEDPVRILRVARFAARFAFAIAPETMALMRRMVEAGEVEDLVAERAWQELARGLAEPHPALMFAALAECGAIQRLLPGLEPDAATLAALERAAAEGAPLAVRFALLAWRAAEPALQAISGRLRVPGEERELALAARRCKDALVGVPRAGAADLLELLKRADALRRPERFAALLWVARLAEPGLETRRAAVALEAAAAVDAGEIARTAASPQEIASKLDAARLDAVARLPGSGHSPDS